MFSNGVVTKYKPDLRGGSFIKGVEVCLGLFWETRRAKTTVFPIKRDGISWRDGPQTRAARLEGIMTLETQ